MRVKNKILCLLCWITVSTSAQHNDTPPLNIGDPAPSLYIDPWIKGCPIHNMRKGHIYILEFWATWCKPCIAEMPHLSSLAEKYKDEITIIGINIYEDQETSSAEIKAFVDNMGDRMNYHVGIDNNSQMLDRWLEASAEKENGIPRSFIVDRSGTLAWTGHPKDLDTVVHKIVNNTWNTSHELKKRNEHKRLMILEEEAKKLLWGYPDDEPDSILFAISKITNDEPKLKMTTTVIFYTIRSLLDTNQKEACRYGTALLASPRIGNLYSIIIDIIDWYSDKRELLPEVYHLGAEAYQQKIAAIAYPEVVDVIQYYNKMALWYFRANEKEKAISSQQKSIKALKSKNDFSVSDLTILESLLHRYEQMNSRK